MKLLLDENLSPRLVELLSDVYPGSQHVADVGLGSTDDAEVWAYAETHGFAIVSRDSDFADRSALKGWPPKVIWIRLGNCRTAAIEMVLRNGVEAVRRFGDGQAACLILGRR
ncbi:DUF5615 family PIN-like protein [Granulicella paludicola]|uniref:DUF5615 family PIN-like protein n=1 Tax=Granulicella paludicola TaxID=474951 RepID=UPI0021DF8006|nr:DUF5615 family PIN-like protein [Granulicella paludicola]